MSFQASAFQNSAFQIGTTVAPSGTVLTNRKPGFAHNFSRKRYEELLAALAAQDALARKAKEATGKRRIALKRAADAAAEAIESAREQAESAENAGQIARLTAAMEAATGAVKVKAIISEARAALDAANAILDDLDEEEVIMLLLN